MVTPLERKYPSGKLIDPDPGEIVNTIIANDDLEFFVQQHPSNGKAYVPAFVIQWHFKCRNKNAKRAALLLNSHAGDDLDEYV